MLRSASGPRTGAGLKICLMLFMGQNPFLNTIEPIINKTIFIEPPNPAQQGPEYTPCMEACAQPFLLALGYMNLTGGLF